MSNLPTELYHYSEHPIKKILQRNYLSRFWSVYERNKPIGFWFAVEYPKDTDDDGWYELCTVCENGIMVRRVRYKYSVKLKEGSNFLLIQNEDELEQFVKTHGYHEKRHYDHPYSEIDRRREERNKERQQFINSLPQESIASKFFDRGELDDIRIDWLTIYKKYQGIIIAPYFYNFRNYWIWYNGWDVASGCVWDTKCIESIELVKKRKIPRIKSVLPDLFKNSL